MAERISGHGTVARALVGVTASLALVVGTRDRRAHRSMGPDHGTSVRTKGSAARWRPKVRRPGRASTKRATTCCSVPTPVPVCRPSSRQQFGTDESLGGANRADTIMLVHTDPRLQKAIVLSFPRDLWVAIPGRGHDRINTAFEGGLRHGGAAAGGANGGEPDRTADRPLPLRRPRGVPPDGEHPRRRGHVHPGVQREHTR